MSGFRQFQLLRGATEDEITVYLSHSLWESRSAFEDWTRSESFRRAHGQAGSSGGALAGHPVFEGYEVVL